MEEPLAIKTFDELFRGDWKVAGETLDFSHEHFDVLPGTIVWPMPGGAVSLEQFSSETGVPLHELPPPFLVNAPYVWIGLVRILKLETGIVTFFGLVKREDRSDFSSDVFVEPISTIERWEDPFITTSVDPLLKKERELWRWYNNRFLGVRMGGGGGGGRPKGPPADIERVREIYERALTETRPENRTQVSIAKKMADAFDEDETSDRNDYPRSTLGFHIKQGWLTWPQDPD